jgi:ABC-type nitrate/sulfonate/bicarbonate transport system permease component
MNRWRGMLSIAVVLVLLVMAWQSYIWVSHVPPYVLPTPVQTAQAIGNNAGLLAGHAWVTLESAVLGLIAAMIVAIGLALTILRWPIAEHVILTYAVLIRTLPIVGIAPIVTLVTGRGLATSVLCVMVVTVFSLLISTIQGFTSVSPEITELSELYATPFRRCVRIALLPGAVASLLQGLRVAAPLAVLGALLAEWLDGYGGIGTLMISASANQEVQLLMAACVVAVMLSLVSFAGVEILTVLADRRGFQVDQMAIGTQR